MKNLFFGAIALTLFAIAVVLVQTSCSKSNAQPLSNELVQLDKIVFVTRNFTTNIPPQIWIANADGTGVAQVPVVLPTDVYVSSDVNTASVKLSPDGQKVFFSAVDAGANKHCIYSCNVDGSNPIRIFEGSDNQYVRLGGSY